MPVAHSNRLLWPTPQDLVKEVLERYNPAMAVSSPNCGWHSHDHSLVTNNDERMRLLREARGGVKYESPLLCCEGGDTLSGRVSNTPGTQDLMHTLGQWHAVIECFDQHCRL